MQVESGQTIYRLPRPDLEARRVLDPVVWVVRGRVALFVPLLVLKQPGHQPALVVLRRQLLALLSAIDVREAHPAEFRRVHQRNR